MADDQALSESLIQVAPELHAKLQSLRAHLGSKVAGRLRKSPKAVPSVAGIARNLKHLAPQALSPPLSAIELFILLASAELIAMAELLSPPADRPDLRARVDYFNHLRTLVVSNPRFLGLEPAEAALIGEVCRAHGMPDFSHLAGAEFSYHPYREVRVVLLSALLRLADALDFLNGRVPSLVSDRARINGSPLREKTLQAISDVIVSAESWEIRVHALPQQPAVRRQLHEISGWLQNEFETVYRVLRGSALHFKRIEFVLVDQTLSDEERRKVPNPFVLLAPCKDAGQFAGRSREIQHVVEMVLTRSVSTIVGESGVGKTSLVEAGVLPELRDYGFRVLRFSFAGDPIEDIKRNLPTPDARIGESKRKQRLRPPSTSRLVEQIRSRLPGERILLVGDHLEQLFTQGEPTPEQRAFLDEAYSIIGSGSPIKFLFCIREDYLAQLYRFSDRLPELTERQNLFHLYRLDRTNGTEVLERAGGHANVRMQMELVHYVVDELCTMGDGGIFPPFLQIVGHRIYSEFGTTGVYGTSEIKLEQYSTRIRDGAESIVNDYLEHLLDKYTLAERPMVAQILNLMVTEYHTKKRTTLRDLQIRFPMFENLQDLLKRLVDDRIVRRSLDEFELIHDFLAKRVLELMEDEDYYSRTVRTAVAFLHSNFANPKLSVSDIAASAPVTRAHLARLFKQQMGTTVKKKLASIRVAAAKAMLADGTLRFGEIAKKCGFRSQAEFSRAFRTSEGVPPRVYIRQHTEQRRLVAVV